MKPEDLARLNVPSDPQIHPDGVRIAFVLTRIDLEEDGYRRQIHLHDGESVQAIHGRPDRWPAPLVARRRASRLSPGDGRQEADSAAGPDAGRRGRGPGPDQVRSRGRVSWPGRPMGAGSASWPSPGHRTWPTSPTRSEEDGPSGSPHFPIASTIGDGCTIATANSGWSIQAARPSPGVSPTVTSTNRVRPGIRMATRIAFVTDRGPRAGLDAGSDVFEVTLDGELTRPVERGGWVLPVYSPGGDLHLIGDPQIDYPRLSGSVEGRAGRLRR